MKCFPCVQNRQFPKIGCALLAAALGAAAARAQDGDRTAVLYATAPSSLYSVNTLTGEFTLLFLLDQKFAPPGATRTDFVSYGQFVWDWRRQVFYAVAWWAGSFGTGDVGQFMIVSIDPQTGRIGRLVDHVVTNNGNLKLAYDPSTDTLYGYEDFITDGICHLIPLNPVTGQWGSAEGWIVGTQVSLSVAFDQHGHPWIASDGPEGYQLIEYGLLQDGTRQQMRSFKATQFFNSLSLQPLTGAPLAEYWNNDGYELCGINLVNPANPRDIAFYPYSSWSGWFAWGLSPIPAPTVTCSLDQPLLWPPNNTLVNVGLGVTVSPPNASVSVLVYANDKASSSDAADIGPGTLQLRSERQGNGNGRVYLIVATATDSAGTSFDVCTVVVPHDHSPSSIQAVQQQAAAAEASYRQSQTVPAGFILLSE
jgi:hypothetical protein